MAILSINSTFLKLKIRISVQLLIGQLYEYQQHTIFKKSQNLWKLTEFRQFFHFIFIISSWEKILGKKYKI